MPFVNGAQWITTCLEPFSLVNPANGEPAESVCICDAEVVDQAVTGALKAFDSWGRTEILERREMLLGIAELVSSHSEELALMDCHDVGKPLKAARKEVEFAAGFFRYYAEALDKRYDQVAPGCTGSLEVLRRVPRGVVAAITPWNFPMVNAALKAAPALAVGNTVVMKPSEYSVRSTLRIAELATEAGLPSGAFNVITGGAETGRLLVQHQGVAHVSFTGSTATGRAIMGDIASSGIKPLVLECGGKSPALIFAEATQLGASSVAQSCVDAALWNQGQVCVSRARLLVEDSVLDEFREHIVAACMAIRPGDPRLETTEFGPLANRRQFERCRNYIENGVQEGATLQLDGTKCVTPNEGGFFLGPSVLVDVQEHHKVCNEEIFGPVITIESFSCEEEAILKANGTGYGLAATIWTNNVTRAHRVARAIRAGSVVVNSTAAPCVGSGFAHSAEPFGLSGFGVEGGLAGLDTYTNLKSIEINHG